jgi:hypothetical protein
MAKRSTANSLRFVLRLKTATPDFTVCVQAALIGLGCINSVQSNL